jgi:hypothetical protein
MAMAGSRASPADQAAAGTRGELLATKLNLPDLARTSSADPA